MENRIEHLISLIAYHEKNLITLNNVASEEEDREYRQDILNRVDRTHDLLGEWRQELAQLQSFSPCPARP